MLSDSNKAINILNDITGAADFSDEYREMLEDYKISETNGYIIKLKVYDEILSGKISSRNVSGRLNLLLAKLSKYNSSHGKNLQYNMDVLIFLNNQSDNKLKCEECGYSVLPIDNYCSRCGSKLIPTISLFELLSGINSSYIKPGDIIKFNTDNTIEIASGTDSTIKSSQENDLEHLFEEKIEKQEIYNKYFKVLLLHGIVENSFQKLDNLTGFYKINNFNKVLEDLLNSNLIEVRNDNIFTKITNLFSKNNTSMEIYNVTEEGIDYLKNNEHVLLYDYYIRNSVIDDIVSFNKFFNEDVSEDNLVSFIRYKRSLFKDDIAKYLSTYDLEAYYYEKKSNYKKQVSILLEKFIYRININYSSYDDMEALDKESISFLNEAITSYAIDLALIKELFSKAYDQLDCSLIFSEEESLNYLLRAFNGEDIRNLNFDLALNINKKSGG